MWRDSSAPSFQRVCQLGRRSADCVAFHGLRCVSSACAKDLSPPFNPLAARGTSPPLGYARSRHAGFVGAGPSTLPKSDADLPGVAFHAQGPASIPGDGSVPIGRWRIVIFGKGQRRRGGSASTPTSSYVSIIGVYSTPLNPKLAATAFRAVAGCGAPKLSAPVIGLSSGSTRNRKCR
jgi:hypothetical protein